MIGDKTIGELLHGANQVLKHALRSTQEKMLGDWYKGLKKWLKWKKASKKRTNKWEKEIEKIREEMRKNKHLR